MADVQDFIDEFHQLEKDRGTTEDTWQEIADYVVPHRTGFDTYEPKKGEKRGKDIYDGTPLGALNMYASGSMGYLLSASYRWFGLRVPDERLMDVREIRLWLANVDTVLDSMINRSNFYKEMFEFFRDGGSFGTATMYRYWDTAQNRECFSVRHPRECFFAENEHGEVDTVFRYTLLSAKNIVKRFKDGTVDEEITKDAQDPQQKHRDYKLLHVVVPNEKYDPEKRDSKSKKYSSYYIDINHESLIRERGYDVMPYAVWRVEKQSDEIYGRGPGWSALSDIKALYQYAKTDIETAQRMVNPPLDIPAERRGQIKFVPGGRNYYEEAGRKVEVLQPTVDLRPGLDREDRKQKIIERHFMVDFFMMMAQAEREMTATEIRRRQEEKAVLLGPHITGLNQDVLDKIIDGLFADAWEAGMIPDPPRLLVESMQGQKLEVDYMGPLAQAQRSFFHAEPYRKTLNDIAVIIQMDPTGSTTKVLDNYDWDRVAREMAKANGLPEESLIDERIRDKIRQARAEQQAKQQQLAAMEQLGKAVPGLNEPVEEGSVLAGMGQQAAGQTAP